VVKYCLLGVDSWWYIRYWRLAVVVSRCEWERIGAAMGSRLRVEYVAEGSSVPVMEAPVVAGPEAAVREFRRVVDAWERREFFVGLYLSSRNAVLRAEVISLGSLNASIVHPREVFVPAIRESAAAIILLHNHPSGDPTPSEEDLAITRRIVEAGSILGVEVLDHVVVGRDDSFVSMRERRLMR
jgi:DNA repair protein RadC